MIHRARRAMCAAQRRLQPVRATFSDSSSAKSFILRPSSVGVASSRIPAVNAIESDTNGRGIAGPKYERKHQGASRPDVPESSGGIPASFQLRGRRRQFSCYFDVEAERQVLTKAPRDILWGETVRQPVDEAVKNRMDLTT